TKDGVGALRALDREEGVLGAAGVKHNPLADRPRWARGTLRAGGTLRPHRTFGTDRTGPNRTWFARISLWAHGADWPRRSGRARVSLVAFRSPWSRFSLLSRKALCGERHGRGRRCGVVYDSRFRIGKRDGLYALAASCDREQERAQYFEL